MFRSQSLDAIHWPWNSLQFNAILYDSQKFTAIHSEIP